MARQVNLRLADELYERVEAARGDVPRERWIRAAVEGALAMSASAPEVSRPFRGQPGPNVENLRSHVQAKRDVRPIPKGKR